MLHKNIQLTTSNKNKIAEFQRFGLPFEVAEGMDLKEVKGNLEDVILYKALDAGVGKLVEDTVLTVDHEEIVDIRWRLEELSQLDNPEIHWTTSLAVLEEDGFVYIYTYSLPCILVADADKVVPEKDAFGFDPYLIPNVENSDLRQTFYNLEKQGLKDLVSPRKMAVERMLSGVYFAKIKASMVPKWTGEYQHD